ncbi:SseB family protein [Phycicoccus sp. M110.8]|uniref:SseB family protein n=1 Tax=Phycicoccus sp. M110.8 TaxID=3075433 RepID=UPI0028FD7347|nr:SseB family protein [Phycicoccus sp. M110.8]MDU0312082.1 SseB family protein [Phycicoccus sp. M110.8]
MTGPADHADGGPADLGGGRADSAGIPFGGRELTGTGFDGDTGSADPALAAALRHPGDEAALVSAVAAARLLVPVVAEPAEVDDSGALAVEKQTDMAAVTLVAPDGTRALPVFTSMASLAAWDAAARPVPVTAARAAQAAVSERCDVMVVDVAGPSTVALRPSMVWALAQQRDWVPAHEDDVVARAVAAAVREQPDVLAHELSAGDPGQGVLRVSLELSPGLTAEQVQAVATAVGERLATDGEVRARIDGLAFSIR